MEDSNQVNKINNIEEPLSVPTQINNATTTVLTTKTDNILERENGVSSRSSIIEQNTTNEQQTKNNTVTNPTAVATTTEGKRNILYRPRYSISRGGVLPIIRARNNKRVHVELTATTPPPLQDNNIIPKQKPRGRTYFATKDTIINPQQEPLEISSPKNNTVSIIKNNNRHRHHRENSAGLDMLSAAAVFDDYSKEELASVAVAGNDHNNIHNRNSSVSSLDLQMNLINDFPSTSSTTNNSSINNLKEKQQQYQQHVINAGNINSTQVPSPSYNTSGSVAPQPRAVPIPPHHGYHNNNKNNYNMHINYHNNNNNNNPNGNRRMYNNNNNTGDALTGQQALIDMNRPVYNMPPYYAHLPNTAPASSANLTHYAPTNQPPLPHTNPSHLPPAYYYPNWDSPTNQPPKPQHPPPLPLAKNQDITSPASMIPTAKESTDPPKEIKTTPSLHKHHRKMSSFSSTIHAAFNGNIPCPPPLPLSNYAETRDLPTPPPTLTNYGETKVVEQQSKHANQLSDVSLPPISWDKPSSKPQTTNNTPTPPTSPSTKTKSPSLTKTTATPPQVPRPRRKCSIPNCENRVVQGGLCIQHGAKRKVCSYEGCTKHVKKNGLCSAHGPERKRCEFSDCKKVAVQGGKCIAHGAKKRLCLVQDCKKQSIMQGHCKKHYDVYMSSVRHHPVPHANNNNPNNTEQSIANNKPQGHKRGLSIFSEMKAVNTIINGKDFFGYGD